MLLQILNNWTNLKVNQQLLHPPQQQLPLPTLLPTFVVRLATNHNPVDRHFENAGAAAQCNIATKSVNERIGAQAGTNKSANDWERRKRRRRGAAAKIKHQNQHKIFHLVKISRNNLCILFQNIGYSRWREAVSLLASMPRVCMSCCWVVEMYSNDAGEAKQAFPSLHEWGPRDPPNPFFAKWGTHPII